MAEETGSLIWIPANRAVPPFGKKVKVRGRLTKCSHTVPGIDEGEAIRSENYRGEDYWQDASDPQAYWSVSHWSNA